MSNNFPKVWCFDMEGTILRKHQELDNGKVAPSAWTTLALKLGDDCYQEEEASKDKWNDRLYRGYLDWMKDSIGILEKHGLKKDIFDEMVREADFYKGAEELFSWLNQKGVITVLISGGFKALADKVQRKYKIDHCFSACELFFNDAGDIEHYNILPTDNEGKVSFLKSVLFEHGYDFDDCIFIGDGKNDVFIADIVKNSISFNGQHELERVAKNIIRQKPGEEDLSEIVSIFKN